MTMSKSKDRKHQRRQRMGGEEHPHSPIQYQAFLKPNNSMAIRRETSHRRAAVVLMMCFMFITTCHHRCYAFSSHSYLSTRPLFVGHIIIPANSPRPLQTKHNVPVGRHRQLELLGHAIDEVDIRIRPNIFVIKTHEDYVKFLEEDDRLCVIKFYAEWCKSCQKFGVKFRQLASDEEGSDKVRFAQIEYTTNAKLCKTLKVNKLPTVHMYRKGRGKIVDMTCKPSLFHLVVDELHRVLGDVDEETGGSESNGNVFEVAMVAGSALGEEIVASLKKEEEVDGTKRQSNWFRLSL